MRVHCVPARSEDEKPRDEIPEQNKELNQHSASHDRQSKQDLIKLPSQKFSAMRVVMKQSSGRIAKLAKASIRKATRKSLRQVMELSISTVANAQLPSFICLVISFAANYAALRGYLFGAQGDEDQTDAQYISGLLLITFTLQYIALCMMNSALLASDRKNRMSGRINIKRAAFQYFGTLLRHTILYYVVALTISILLVWTWQCLIPSRYFFTNGELYLAFLCSLLYSVPMDIRMKKIRRLETKEANPNLIITHISALHNFLRSLAKMLAGIVSISVATIYVQAIHSYYTSHVNPLLFTGISIFFKVCMQELSKRLLVAGNIRDIRVMVSAISISTIIIDCQTRIVLRRSKGAVIEITGIMLMSAAETLLRMGKLTIIKAYDHYLKSRATSRQKSLTPSSGNVDDDYCLNTVQGKDMILSLHTAEIYAEMCSEYIAICCAACHVWLNHTSRKQESILTTSFGCDLIGNEDMYDGHDIHHFDELQSIILPAFYSMLAEIAVDMISCYIEISFGLEYRTLWKHRMFMLSIFIFIAVANVQIYSLVYLKRTCT